jgi:membrane fusion protein, multidrug efflux system
MKRLLSWLIVLAAGAFAVLWQYPPSRALLVYAPPLKTVLDKVLPAEQAATAPNPKGRSGPPPTPVTVATAEVRPMPVVLTAPGTVEAEATVAVKTRVDGQIAEVLFKEGDLVQKGQLLFRLDERLIMAQIKQAEANIKRDQANLQEAMATMERRDTLVQKKIVSEAARDTAKTSVEALKASIAAGQAALEAQKTQLDYLTIKAPITGRTGNTPVEPGSNIRAADTTALVTINQIRPIAVTFSLPQAEIAALRRALAAGATAEVRVGGQAPFVRTGKIDFIDNQVDKATGTLAAKLQVANEDEALWPGLAVEVALTVEQRPNMIAVPASAVLPSQQGMIVWVVNAENRSAPRPVALDRVVGQTAYLSEGLKSGDVVVTDGQVRLAPNGPVVIRDPNAKGPPGAKKGDAKSAPKGEAADTKKDERTTPAKGEAPTPATKKEDKGPRSERRS